VGGIDDMQITDITELRPVVRIDFDQRAKLLAADPTVCYVTDHYMNYPTVLVRLSRIDRKSLTDLLGSAWGFVSSGTKANVREQKAKRKR
jgi:hypothetical protein